MALSLRVPEKVCTGRCQSGFRTGGAGEVEVAHMAPGCLLSLSAIELHNTGGEELACSSAFV